MPETYRIDSHKLIFHPHWVANWLDKHQTWEEAKNIYPIYLELSPTGACNHRCRFCAFDYLQYKPIHLDLEVLRKQLFEMASLGIKSIMLAGEGEPLLYKDINKLIALGKEAGLDMAITSNGVKLNQEFIEHSLDKLVWIKISLNAGSKTTYAYIHGTREEDFSTVLNNLKEAVAFKTKQGIKTTIGAQILLLPENRQEIKKLISICRDDLGLDYLVIKPYSQHQFSITKIYNNLDYQDFLTSLQDVEGESSPEFKVILRKNALKKSKKQKKYQRCYATPFLWAHITTNGDVYSCSAFLGDQRFCLGNINKQTFQEIWTGRQRQDNYKLLRDSFNTDNCRLNCRMEMVNEYLYNLKDHPPAHVNFI